MTVISSIILISAVLIYALRVLFFITGSLRMRKLSSETKESEYFPYVSVIIPSRNEEENIADSVKSVAANEYPADKFEIIAVNDRSTDKTGLILQQLLGEVSNLKIINVEKNQKSGSLKGKPGALQAGMDIAQGEIILMTDADCLVRSGWINAVVRNFQDRKIGLVPSFVIVTGIRIFEKIQAIEWIFLNTMAMAAVGWGQYLGCYGNNLSVRKETLDKIGGYRNIPFSVTEDLALLKAVIKSGSEARYILDYDAVVYTKPVDTFKEYIRQHHRWANGGMGLGWRAAIFVVSTAVQWLGLIVSITQGAWIWFIAIILTRLLGDFFIILYPLRVLKQNRLKYWVFPTIIFLMLLEPFLPILLLNQNIVWKDQTFRS